MAAGESSPTRIGACSAVPATSLAHQLGMLAAAGFVEVVADADARVLVRDTKNRGGPVLAFRPDAWRRFARQVKVSTLPA